jgi:putative transposase
MVTFRYRIKDATSSKHLLRMAWAVNTMWHYCNEVSLLALRRDRRWLSAFELINLVAGTSKTLGLHADTLNEICREYVAKRRTCSKARPKWRSRKRSLEWLPFKARVLRIEGNTITYLGRCFRFWHSRPLEGTVKIGNFAQDVRGHGYVNLQCEVANATEPPGSAEIGIDPGCVNQRAYSDRPEPYSRKNLTRKHAAQPPLGRPAP